MAMSKPMQQIGVAIEVKSVCTLPDFGKLMLILTCSRSYMNTHRKLRIAVFNFTAHSLCRHTLFLATYAVFRSFIFNGLVG